MADPELKTSGDPETGPPREGIRLTKEERKELLAQIERQLSRTETPERILQRAEHSLSNGDLDQARRLLQHLESVAPRNAGLPILRDRIDQAARRERLEVNLRKAEEMLRRYIKERKKPLAELALETLVEIAPNHPRRGDYETWVADLDQEVKLQERLEQELGAGRAAVRAGDFAGARRRLDVLRGLDPAAAAELSADLDATEQGEAESADIARTKQRFEDLLRAGELDDAERQVDRLAILDVPKLTVDFLRRRLEEARARARDQADAERLTARFDQHLADRDWQAAREVAHSFGERFPDRPEGGLFFNRVTELEAAERRQQSLEQGLATLEKFIAEGRRQEAEVALKLLERLQLDPAQLVKLRRRVEST